MQETSEEINVADPDYQHAKDLKIKDCSLHATRDTDVLRIRGESSERQHCQPL
jgi:hypothetical protein